MSKSTIRHFKLLSAHCMYLCHQPLQTVLTKLAFFIALKYPSASTVPTAEAAS